MWKKCTLLWREAHVEVKMAKHPMFGPFLDVQPHHTTQQRQRQGQPQQTTNSKQRTTNKQQPTTNNRQPTTDNRQPTTDNQQPTTNNHNNNNNKKHNKHKKQKHKQHKNVTKRCVTSCGMKSKSYCALHLHACAEHMNNTNAETILHYPYGITSVQSPTIIST